MNDPVRGDALTADEQLSPLFRAWLAGHAGGPAARDEWRRFLQPSPPAAPAPAWTDAAWRDRWLADLLVDQPDEASRRLCRAQVDRLVAGTAEVVVTGQQPGFLGAPLYTLYKAAATVAAAAARTAAGRPTVPLFWFGDDDDDRVEAFAPWVWDPPRGALLRAQPPDGPADQMVGAAVDPAWSGAEAAWLADRAARGGLAAELSAIWRRGRDEGLGWGRLQRRALLRLFAGAGLLAVSGDDPLLHAAAAPFYAALWPRRDALARRARLAGAALVAAGFHAQLGEGSLARPLHLAGAGRRLTLSAELAGAPAPPTASLLRPGVLLRSPVQDWLFHPAGVVVGPGELAYLVQMQGVYEELGLARAPLLPRLFARAVPAATAGGPTPTAASTAAATDWQGLAASLVEGPAAALTVALQEAGAERGSAATLAAREAARWRDGAARLLARAAATARAAAGGQPPWVQPLGRRQERTLALHGATALWGEPFVAAAREAARLHFVEGERERWSEFLLPVPPPE